MTIVILDWVAKAWIGDQQILSQYLIAKRAYKARPTVLTKISKKEAGKRLKPALIKLKEKILRDENSAAVDRYASEGVLPMEPSSDSSKCVKAIEHMIRQID